MTKLTFDIEKLLRTERGINLLGEFLRNYFFDQSKGTGCYSTFELNSEVKELPQENIEDWDDVFNPNVKYTVASREGIIMRYYWDGDGYLEFILPNDKIIFNSDCKKDHGWRGGSWTLP